MTGRRGAFAGLLVADAISTGGTRMSQLAVPWLVLITTHSPVATGLVGAAEIAPYVVLQVLAAPLVDRFGGWRISVTGSVIAGLSMLAIPLSWDAGAHALGPLLALVFLAGLARGPVDSAAQVLLPSVSARAGLDIDRASALFDGASRAAMLLAAPAGGVLIGGIGAANVVAIDAATFLVSAALVAGLVPAVAGDTSQHQPVAEPHPSGEPHSVAEPQSAGEPHLSDSRPAAGPPSYLAQLGEGFRFVRTHRLLRSIAGMLLFTNFADAAMSGLLLLLWAQHRHGDTAALGVVVGAFGVGAVAGSVVLALQSTRLPRRWTFAVTFLLAGAPRFLVLAMPAPLWMVLATWGLAGFGAGAINPLLAAAEYDAVPRPLQARVLGTVGALAWAGIPFGALTAGAVVAATGLRTTLLIGAGLYLAATADPFLRGAWALMDRRPPSLAPVATGQ